MTNWTDIATCLNSSEPNPWMQSYGWHAADCGRSDHEPNVIAFDSWTLLELHVHRPDDFPTLLDSQKLNSDPSLALMNGQILGFVCTNTRNFTDSSMHYWFVETEDGALRYAFDSLKGLQRLTQDLAKKLFVTGVLLFFGPRKSPVLRTSELDAAAGVLPRIVRAPNPIRVLGRQRASKVRNFLCRAHGVRKRKHIPAKRHKASTPLKHGKPKKSKALLAGAVTQPAKGNGIPTKGCGGNRPSTVSRRRSTATRKVKHIPPRGQIDALFRQQLSTGSDTPTYHPDRATLVEDISDEEFEKHDDRQLLQSKNTALATGFIDQRETAMGLLRMTLLPLPLQMTRSPALILLKSFPMIKVRILIVNPPMSTPCLVLSSIKGILTELQEIRLP